jgi:predicted protein tyrosine phosphatase
LFTYNASRQENRLRVAEFAEVYTSMKMILFVCTANICRSPMAEAVLNAVAEDRSLSYRAKNAGTAALEGSLS